MGAMRNKLSATDQSVLSCSSESNAAAASSHRHHCGVAVSPRCRLQSKLSTAPQPKCSKPEDEDSCQCSELELQSARLTASPRNCQPRGRPAALDARGRCFLSCRQHRCSGSMRHHSLSDRVPQDKSHSAIQHRDAAAGWQRRKGRGWTGRRRITYCTIRSAL